jgi:DNA-binding CsgD family transcriptional regulator
MISLVNPHPLDADRLYGAAIKRTEPVRLSELAAPYGRSGVLPRRGRVPQPWELVGRGQEVAVIRAFVGDCAVHGRALLLSGEPGIGKSALLDAAEETAATAGIRVLRATGAESEDVGFSGLNQLLLPLRAGLSGLGERQRNALNVALGFSDGRGGDRLVVSNAVLDLLLRSAVDSPLLLIVDNLHRVDQASAQVLGFITRRLRGSRVGLIAAERTAATHPSTLDVPGYDVRPLDGDASARLIATRFPDLAAGVRQRIVTEASGNPRALLELPAGLTEQQRSAVEALPAVLPLTARLAAHLRDQPQRMAWHLAGAAGQPRDHRETGQPRRLATAAYLAASVLGDLGAAEALVGDARRACRGGETSAETDFATAFVLLHADGDVATAHELLLRGMQTARDADAEPLGAGQAMEMLVTVCQLSGRAEHGEALGRLRAETGSTCGPDERAAAARTAELRATAGQLGAQIASLTDHAEADQIVRTARAAVLSDRLSDCRQALRYAARSEPVGPPAMQAGVLLALEAYQTGQWDEAWRLAATAAGLCASRGYQLLRRQAQTVQALVAACRGDGEGARVLADEVTRWAAPRGITSLLAGAHYASALAALAQSDFQTAHHQATRISPAGDIPAGQPYAAWALLDLVEAALRIDRPGDAAAHVAAVRQSGLASASPRLALLSAAAIAMTAPDEEAPALFDRALATEGAERWPFDRARVHLLYGDRLRRVRAVNAARVQLSAAVEEFRRLGAPTWADRAATALRATGQVRQGPNSHHYQQLTPQELEIARLAAAGLSNKQIGERLYMSHRTVGSHLYRIFPKLGITSRAALGSALPRQAD